MINAYLSLPYWTIAGSVTEAGRRFHPSLSLSTSPLSLKMLYTGELERLQKLLHFPEEVALQLTEVCVTALMNSSDVISREL